MLNQIGKKQAPRPDLVRNLLDCHHRIRYFSGLAGKLAATEGVPAEEVQYTALAIARHFRESLPIHAIDEEKSLLPRLVGKNQQLDEALERMAIQHDEHEPMLTELLQMMGELAEQPSTLKQLRPALSSLAERLQGAFALHLEQEEHMIFPALTTALGAEQHNEIMLEMTARRQRG